MVRRVFYSFHYESDSRRAARVRNIGAIEGTQPATDNKWEAIKKGGDEAIKKWIADEMHGRSCTVVLVGEKTAGRKWIKYEIVESWNKGMGVVGIHIHGLVDLPDLNVSRMGRNPFELIDYGSTGKKLSSIVRCYNPAGRNGQEKYNWIRTHLTNVIEEAIKIRKNNSIRIR